MTKAEDYVVLVKNLESSIDNTVNTFLITQILMFLVLSMKLKQMWTLLNMLQILAYSRHFIRWPVRTEFFLQ